MAHAFKWRITEVDAVDGWNVVNPVDGAVVATYLLPIGASELAELKRQAPAMVRCGLYGLKQTVADGGAKVAGTSVRARKAGMDNRYASVVAGTWDFRTGTGAGGLPDGDVFTALVALGKTADNADRRDAWKKLGAPKRAAIRRMADVAEWLENNSVTPDADDAFADFIQTE